MTNRYTNVPKSDNKPENVVIIRGGGDLASGTIHRLYRCGYRLLVLECEKPTAIRRMVSFCEAVYDGQSSVEGVLCRKVDSVEECEAVWKAGEIPLMADTEGTVLKKYRPAALIDAILAKKNLGTTREMADLTVGLGPGFVAGEDVDYVVETMSNRESGDGFGDILIRIEDEDVGIVIEVKYADDGNLQGECEKALQQIIDIRYTEALEQEGIHTIIKYGITCYRKKCKVLMRIDKQ